MVIKMVGHEKSISFQLTLVIEGRETKADIRPSIVKRGSFITTLPPIQILASSNTLQ